MKGHCAQGGLIPGRLYNILEAEDKEKGSSAELSAQQLGGSGPVRDTLQRRNGCQVSEGVEVLPMLLRPEESSFVRNLRGGTVLT